MGSTQRDVHVDVPLSQVAMAYQPTGFIAEQIAPIVNVKKESDAYYIWSIADVYRTEDDYRARATEANVIEYSVSSAKYYCDNYALKDRIPYEDLKNADGSWDFTARNPRAERVKSKLYLNWEQRVANLCTSTSNIGSSTTVASAWTGGSNADPVGNINTGINNVLDVTGYRPNRMIMGEYAWRTFRENDNVIDRIYGTAGQGDPARLVNLNAAKALFEMDDIYIGRAYYNSSQEGQTASLSQLWNDVVLMYYAPSTPSKDEPSFMYSFRWDAVPGMNMQAYVYDLPRAKAEEVEVGYYQDEVITGSTLGFLIKGVGSSQ